MLERWPNLGPFLAAFIYSTVQSGVILAIVVTDWISSTVNYLNGNSGFIIAVFTALLAYLAHRSSKHFVASERAYVTMSPLPPGLEIDCAKGHVTVAMEIKNTGRTPATVTDVLIKMLFLRPFEALPEAPDYHQEGKLEPSEAFLVTNGTSFNRRTHRFDPEALKSVQDGSVDLWLYGYVDYDDQFGRRYRGGYARLYRHDSPLTTNLHLGKNTRNYNYDKRL